MTNVKDESRMFKIILTFCIMFIFWVLLSAWTVYLPEPYDFTKVSRGVMAALIVTFLTYEIFVPCRGKNVLLKTRRFIPYLGWELWQIYLATIDVAKRVFGILEVDPQIIEFDTTLRSDFALVSFANSITLTPGTITIDIPDPEKGRYIVHAIAKGPADSLTVDQTMQKKVGHVFMEE
jgi:multicomponent Na+:H+ antiporter subunit E